MTEPRLARGSSDVAGLLSSVWLIKPELHRPSAQGDVVRDPEQLRGGHVGGARGRDVGADRDPRHR